MLPVLNIGPLAIQFPGLLILSGIWIGIWLAEKQAPGRGISKEELNKLILLALLCGIISSRLFYIFQFSQAFIENPIDLLSLNPGLLDTWGGLVGALLAAWIFITRRKLPVLQILDVLSLGVSFFMITLSLADLASGDAFGAPTQVPWAIELWGAEHHPTQVYNAVLNAGIFSVLWMIMTRQKIQQPGMIFLVFLSLSALVRLFVEAFRGDSLLLPGGIRIAQVLAWFVLAACLWLLGRKLRYRPAG